MTRFSVIIPFHAAAETLSETLISLQRQSFDDWEAICVNDRSPDGTDKIVAAFAARDRRIRLVTSPGPGPSIARNHAASLATGSLLAFCDADDLWSAKKLSQLDRYFSGSDVAGVFGRIGFFTRSPEDSRTQSTVPAGRLSIAQLLAENPVCTMSNLTLRRDAFVAVGGLDRDAVHNEDLELLIRLVGLGYPVEGLDALQVWYRTAPTGLSADLNAMRIGRERALKTAARFGVHVTPQAEAIYMRYLARRALRLDTGPRDAWSYTLAGLRHSPSAFFSPARRGVATAVASVLAFVLTPRMRHALFSR